MSSRSNHPLRGEIDHVAKILIDTWAKCEPEHGVTKYPASYVATFVDMARAVVEDLAHQTLVTDKTIGGQHIAFCRCGWNSISYPIVTQADHAAAAHRTHELSRQMFKLIASSVDI